MWDGPHAISGASSIRQVLHSSLQHTPRSSPAGGLREALPPGLGGCLAAPPALCPGQLAMAALRL